CDQCGNLVFFENVQCVKCGHTLGFLPDLDDLGTLEPTDDNSWRALAAAAKGRLYRQCANGAQHQICNWVIPIDDPDPFCVACRLNQTIPDLTVPENHERWHKLELAKRRVIYTLLRLGLPLEGVPAENIHALRFAFLGNFAGEPPVPTSHSDGLITINITEADDAERERQRIRLHEPYRTLLGHLRHEVAHYYWDRIIANSRWLPRFRTLFGDESLDYSDALQTYYQQGPHPDWSIRSVSPYASAHPWEDWAETWAHYLHMVDTMETAADFGITVKPTHGHVNNQRLPADTTELLNYRTGFDRLIGPWFPLTYALNSLNRGMGLPDLYPFVLSARALDKLRFVHEVIQGSCS
ncbi:MAG: hypothetical protein JWR69_4213, partial [Pedosphaera sp.]|nr:hypothetical protein [Pedosphaera sp.]